MPVIEPTTTMLPRPRATMAGRNARHLRYTPVRFAPTVASQSAGNTSHSGAVGPGMPAARTSASGVPKRSATPASPSAS